MPDRTLTARATPGVSRYAYKRTTGWLARYYAEGRTLQRFFADSRYAYDPDASLVAARAWLQTCLTTWEPRPRFRRTSRKSTTGCVGICLRTKRERNGATFLVYDVSYVLDGRRRTRTFRIHLYASQAAAFAAAHRFRAAMERAMQRERRAALRQAWTRTSREHLEACALTEGGR